MKLVSFCIWIFLAAGPVLAGEEDTRSPIAANSVVEIKGSIEKVEISAGARMPSLVVKHGNSSTQVFLGSRRYLMENNFNPKAGEEVAVKGYKTTDSVVAIRVTLPAAKQTLQFRDDRGWPLWGGNRAGRGRWRK